MGILGPKTQHLQELQKLGFKVPAFIGIEAKTLMKGDFVALSGAVQKKLKCSRYAVRSSALVEDLGSSSQAGQFLTLLDVESTGLSAALQKVTQQAQKKLGNLKDFSILVQEFIEPDFAGVCFTREPSGGREWVLEYSAGRGDQVVGGELRPVQLRGIWGQKGSEELLKGLPQGASLLRQFQKIEEHYGFPQDIEWCVLGKQSFILQTRPISTFPEGLFLRLKKVDALLPKRPFFYQKTEISEIAPRPDKETLALLCRIYAAGGPVQTVYSKYGVRYSPEDFLRLCEGELYVDKEVELRTLLPAYSYFNGEELLVQAKPRQLKGLFMSLRNLSRLRRLPLENFLEVEQTLEKALKAPSLQPFLKDYEQIFEINLLSAVALARLRAVLGRLPVVSLSELLLFAFTLFPELPRLKFPFKAKDFCGNALDLQDTSPFVPHLAPAAASASLHTWWRSLSSVQRKLLEPPLRKAAAFARLREYARWLLVRHTNALRPCKKRKALPFLSPLPTMLSSGFLSAQTALECLSPGKAEGRLLSLEDFKKGKTGLLYTTLLSPDLVRYFPQIQGILAEKGGLLSHLAIMAREHGIPVLSGVRLEKDLHLGQRISMNATQKTFSVLGEKTRS